MPTSAKARARDARQPINHRIKNVLTILHEKGELRPGHDRLIAQQFGTTVRSVQYMMSLVQRDGREVKAKTGVFAVAVSQGLKTGPVAATYVAQKSCPTDCAFLHNGCYAENGFIGGMITKRLNRLHEELLTPFDLALNEAAAIDKLPGGVDLRLHIVGDSTTIGGTKVLAAACARYVERNRRQGTHVDVWTYTHAWRTVPRSAWGAISVLASCETEADVHQAESMGYATAMTVREHKDNRRYGEGGLSLIPCVEQTKGVQCVDCRLCFDDQRLLKEGLTIGFAVHGKKNVALAAIEARRC